MHESRKGVVSSVGTVKSKRLDAIRKKAGLAIDSDSQQTANKQYGLIEGLKPQEKELFIQAQKIIDKRLESIIKTYPVGKTKSLFKIKHGLTVEQLKSKKMKDIFAILKISEAEIKQFRLIGQLDLYGNQVN